MTTETTDINEALLGANKSAEGADGDEGADSSSVSGINVIMSNRLVETGFANKKGFQAYAKEYMGKMLGKLKEDGASDDDVQKFKTAAGVFVKKVCSEFKDWQFFMGESCDGSAGLAYVKWDEEVPHVYMFKVGLEGEKV